MNTSSEPTGRAAALDLGSRRTKGVIVEDGTLVEMRLWPNMALARDEIEAWVAGLGGMPLGATGYGRRWAGERFGAVVHTEVRAFARGVARHLPGTRTLVDIGGQDAKCIVLDDLGGVADFEMNDRCAAGTGKFFEMLARALGVEFPELVTMALAATEAAPLSATCAVFAESELIGLLAERRAPETLARGGMRAVAQRLAAMLNRTGAPPPIRMAGGGGNAALARELATLLGQPVEPAREGEYLGALGAALLAASAATAPGL